MSDNNIRIIYTDQLPDSVRGVCSLIDEKDFLIAINANYPEEVQEKALAHEMQHIINGDFFSNETADHIEARTHMRTETEA